MELSIIPAANLSAEKLRVKTCFLPLNPLAQVNDEDHQDNNDEAADPDHDPQPPAEAQHRRGQGRTAGLTCSGPRARGWLMIRPGDNRLCGCAKKQEEDPQSLHVGFSLVSGEVPAVGAGSESRKRRLEPFEPSEVEAKVRDPPLTLISNLSPYSFPS